LCLTSKAYCYHTWEDPLCIHSLIGLIILYFYFKPWFVVLVSVLIPLCWWRLIKSIKLQFVMQECHMCLKYCFFYFFVMGIDVLLFLLASCAGNLRASSMAWFGCWLDIVTRVLLVCIFMSAVFVYVLSLVFC